MHRGNRHKQFDLYPLRRLLHHRPETFRVARERIDIILPRTMEAAGVTEELKTRNPMRWMGLMNTLKAQTEEIILLELIEE